MSGHIKLVVGSRVEFDVRFVLNDEGQERSFGMRLSANRQPLEEQRKAVRENTEVIDFLRSRGVSMVSWLGKPPLVDEKGAPIPAGEQALEALYELVGGMVGLVFAAYLDANGAKGKAGN